VTERLGIGFVGLGGIARERHVPGFRAISGVTIEAVATSSPASAQATARELGIPRVHADWRAVVDDPAVDAVVVAAWPDLHAPVTLAALAAGKHVLTQARMAMDAVEAEAMLAASRAHPQLVAMVVPSPFSLWADRTIARVVADRTLGEVRTVRATWSGGVVGTDPWRRLRRHSGNNTLSLGIVYEAMLRWLPAATAVSAAAMTAVPTMPGPDGSPVAVDIPDHLVAVAELPGPALASIELSASRRAEPNTAWLFGTERTLRADFDAGRLELAALDGRREPVEVPPDERGEWRVEREFVDAIRHGIPVTRTDFATGVRYMRFTDAVVEAVRAGRRVEVAPDDCPAGER
jgi:predicted dehydrogenase